MFGFVTYIKNLTSKIDKNVVLTSMKEDAIVIEEYIPVLKSYIDFLNKNGSKSKVTAAMAAYYLRSYDGPVSNNAKAANSDVARMLTIMQSGLVKILPIVDELIKISDKDLPDTMVKNGVSVKDGVILKVSESIRLTISTAVTILKYVSVMETNYLSGTNDSTLLTKNTIKSINNVALLNGSMIAYFRSIKPKTMVTDLNSITNYTLINSDSDLMTEKMIDKSLLKLSSVKGLPIMAGFVGNPIYHIRLAVADWQIASYNKRKEDKKTLELKLLYLKSISNNEENPKLEKQIQFYEKRVAKLAYNINQIEEEAA